METNKLQLKLSGIPQHGRPNVLPPARLKHSYRYISNFVDDILSRIFISLYDSFSSALKNPTL